MATKDDTKEPTRSASDIERAQDNLRNAPRGASRDPRFAREAREVGHVESDGKPMQGGRADDNGETHGGPVRLLVRAASPLGFRRNGFHFTTEWARVAVSEEIAERLYLEPALTIKPDDGRDDVPLAPHTGGPVNLPSADELEAENRRSANIDRASRARLVVEPAEVGGPEGPTGGGKRGEERKT